MVYKIKSTNNDMYKNNLAGFVATKIILQKKKILFIDCMNYISQYMFKRHHVETIMDNLFLSRIELIHDLVDILKSIHFNSFFRQCDVFLISSFNHLLKDKDEASRRFYKNKILQFLERIEAKYGKEVVIMGLNKKWVTQYRLNA